MSGTKANKSRMPAASCRQPKGGSKPMAYLALPIIGFLFLSPLRIDILFLRNDKGDKLIMTLKPLWGALKIPVNVEKAREEMDPDVPRTIKKIDPRIYWHLLYLLPKARGRIKVRELKLRADFSLGDAALTGMASGILWSLTGGLLTLVRDYFRLKAVPAVAINPIFNQKRFLDLHARGNLEVSYYTLIRLFLALAVQALKEVGHKLALYRQKRAFSKTPMKEG